jgi:hypothetical protein
VLKENISKGKLYGDSEENEHNRSEIIDRLNELLLDELEVSFNELCEMNSSTSRYPECGSAAIASDKGLSKRGKHQEESLLCSTYLVPVFVSVVPCPM